MSEDLFIKLEIGFRILKRGKIKMRIYHIIDHNGFGSIHKLLIPLCEKYSNNILYTPYLKRLSFNKRSTEKN